MPWNHVNSSMLVSAFVASAVHAAAQTQGAYQFNLPPQELSTSLRAVGRQAGINVIFEPALVEGLKASGFRAELTAEGAIKMLLAGTKLGFQRVSADTIVVKRESEESASAAARADSSVTSDPPVAKDPLRLAQTDTAAAADDIGEVVVTSKIVFTQNDAFGATKMGLAVKDTPQSVITITSDLIDASGLLTLNDVYKVDASGDTAHGRDGFPRNFYRGFAQQGINAIRVDGFRMPGNIDLDLATLERFEVIKGPTSTLYGQSPIGGTLNAVSKQPQREFSTALQLEADEYDAYRADFDVTGPIAASDALSFRLIGAYKEGDTFRDFGQDDRRVLSGAVRFAASEATSYVLSATYQNSKFTPDFSSPLQLAGNGTGTLTERVLAEGLKIADIPRSRFLGMPWNHVDDELKLVRLQAEHLFGNRWNLRANTQYNRVRYQGETFRAGAPFDENGNSDYSFQYARDQEQEMMGGEVNLFGPVELFGREHTVFVGVDYTRIDYDERLGIDPEVDGFENSRFNILNPDYTTIARRAALSDFVENDDSIDRTTLAGITTQLMLHATDRLSALLGARYSMDRLESRSRSGTPAEIDGLPLDLGADLKFKNFTLQTGLTYKLTPAANLYASYGETFEPGTARVFSASSSTGKLIDPEEGTNYELGLKADASRELSFTAAIFQMERTNIRQPDSNHPGFQIALGTQRSRGVELGVQGRITPQFSIFASAAYLKSEFSQGRFDGMTAPNAPRFGLSAFGSYEILNGGLKGLGWGLGVVQKSGRETFDRNYTKADGSRQTFDFGNFVEVDARVFYGRDHWMAALAVSNVFNEEYYSSTGLGFDGGIQVNPPRTLKATLRYKF